MQNERPQTVLTLRASQERRQRPVCSSTWLAELHARHGKGAFHAAHGYAAPVELPQAPETGVERAELPPMLDACCGSRMFWFDRANPLALYMDKREEQHVLCDGRELKISPDVVADFTDMPFPDESFWLVVFDPPHMNSLGANSWLAKKYGRLIGDWRDDLREGFSECFRVLKTNGTLVFKWNTTDISLEEVLALAPCPPVFGHTTGRQAKTVWATFFKGGGGAERQGEKPSATEARHTGGISDGSGGQP